MSKARTLAIALGWLAASLCAPAAALAEECDPSGDEEAERVVTTPRPSGYQVTEVYGEGVYRVSRCTTAGELIEGQTVAPIHDPAGEVTLVPSTYRTPRGDGSVLYGDPRDPVWRRAWAAAGDEVEASVLPPPRGVDVDVPEELPPPPAGGEVRAAQADAGACRTGAFVRYDSLARWPTRRYSYRINGASFGNNKTTRRSLVAGHKSWDDTRNDCGFGDRDNIRSNYLGLTTRKARSAADGASVIDKGEIANITRCGNSRVVIACSWMQPDQVVGPYTENDQRYDDDYRFTNGGDADAYDYWHIATHETGHSIGLDHTTASARLTMFPQASRAATFWRTLGLGDVLGMRDIYP